MEYYACDADRCCLRYYGFTVRVFRVFSIELPCLSHSFLRLLELPYGDAQAAKRKNILATFMISHNSAFS